MKIFVRQVLQGKALSLGDAVDVLTLQDNVKGAENYYATALHLLAHAEVSRASHGLSVAVITTITQGYSRRDESFRIIWFRIYNHDEYVPFPCLVLRA
jgi:nuclear pore complex protein Nup133